MRILSGKRFGSVPGGIRVTKNVREPNETTLFCTNRFSPSMIDATEITDVTPITIPRMVSAERTLCERSVSNATNRFSMASCRVMSFGPQSHYRIKFGRARRRINPKEKADRGTDHQSEECHPSL